MIVKHTEGLGNDALQNPNKYSGFMGVSIRNSFFSHNTMESYFIWASEFFKTFKVFLLDYPDRYNYIVFSSDDHSSAVYKACQMGKEKKVGYERVVCKLGLKNIQILSFQDFNNDILYHNTLFTCNSYLSQNNEYKTDLERTMMNSIGSKIHEYFMQNSLSEKQKKLIIKTLFQYIIEELASIVYLTEKGNTIEVDPYKELPTKRGLYEGKYKSLANQLKITERGHIYALPE